MPSSRLRQPLVICAALGLALAAFIPAGAADRARFVSSQAALHDELIKLAARARPGTLGIAVLDLQTGMQARVNADQAYPMMSVFKAPVAATVLSQIDQGKLALSEKVTLTRADVRDGSAVPSIGVHFKGERMTFTVDRLLTAAVSESDNTAADALVRLVGGPSVVTAFLRAHAIEGMRVDRDEGGIARIFDGLAPGQSVPANETSQQQQARRRRGFNAYLADPDNRSTPDAAVTFLRKLHGNELLSRASTGHLLRLMEAQTVPDRMRAGLPPGVRLADKCGSSITLEGETAAYNDIGILTWPDGHVALVAAFLTDSHASVDERNEVFADLAKQVVATVRP